METNKKLDRLTKAILTAMAEGSLDAATANSLIQGVETHATANLPLTPASPIQLTNRHDDTHNDQIFDEQLMEQRIREEIELEKNRRGIPNNVRGDARIVSPAAALAPPNSGKTNTGNKKRKATEAAGGMRASSRANTHSGYDMMTEKMRKGSKMAARKSGLELYSSKKIEAFLKEVMRKRLPVTALGERNPLRVDERSMKSWGTVKPKLRRLLNFVTDNCITENEFKCWSSQLPPLEADVAQSITDERNKRTDAVAKALAGRCVTWWKERATIKKNGKYADCKTGSLQNHIDNLSKEDKKAYDDMNQLNTKKRTTDAAAAAAAVEGGAE